MIIKGKKKSRTTIVISIILPPSGIKKMQHEKSGITEIIAKDRKGKYDGASKRYRHSIGNNGRLPHKAPYVAHTHIKQTTYRGNNFNNVTIRAVWRNVCPYRVRRCIVVVRIMIPNAHFIIMRVPFIVSLRNSQNTYFAF